MVMQGVYGWLIVVWCVVKVEVDLFGVKGVQGVELFSYYQWRVVRQYYVVGFEMQGGGVGGEIVNQY